MENAPARENKILYKNADGVEIEADVLRLTPFLVVFEVRNPNFVLKISDVLNDFKIVLNNRALYTGRVVVANLLNSGMGYVCEAKLDDKSLDARALSPVDDIEQMKAAFAEFMAGWGKNYRIQPGFKVLIADMASYLAEMRLWFEQVELSLLAMPAEERPKTERQLLTAVHKPVVVSLNALFEKFEDVAAKVAPDDKPAHHAWVRRSIHPLVLASPFADRTYQKPLGYAGDYEMVNMILRDPYEGRSLFAKALNGWFLDQPPAEAHRNRIIYLTQKLVDETVRVCAFGRKARIFNLGCGPAGEIQRFLSEYDLSNHADLTLLDFNDETLAYTTQKLKDLKTRHHRNTDIHMVKRSVAQILTGRGKGSSAMGMGNFDFVYCAGLFDYLPDNYCRQLMNIFYEMLAPGGLLVATNVDAVNPIQEMLDYVLDWNLIYRSGKQLATVAPKKADPDRVSVIADSTSVNIYLEVRKPTS